MTIQEQIADAVEFALIEQLGGYEKAKEWYIDQDLRGNHTVRIRCALLQYRRAHNIYEVGDKFVMLKIWHDDLMTVEDGDMDEPCWNTRIIRHATDAEIEAGCRL